MTRIKQQLGWLSAFRMTTRSKRLGALLVVAAAAVVVVIASVGAKDQSEYLVRVNFVDGAAITKGADVRVAGANVGIIHDVFVSKNNQASVVVAITDPAFQRFYEDATCQIHLQSLIGEKFVDCKPGTPSKPELRVDPTDSSRRLMLSNKTGSPVDVDQILNSMREPQRERFRIIINELGVTLTGRGQDLQEILNRFDPTLKEVDDILRILARENDKLVTLAVDGDRALQSLSENRKHITSLFKNADIAARATNEKRAELAETLARLPAFLNELEPTARKLKEFSDEAAPVAHAAALSGKDLSTFVTGTNEFVAAANPALQKFGDATDVFREQIPKIDPIATQLKAIGDNGAAVTNLKKLLTSFQDKNGYKNLAAMAIGLAGAANGYDAFGHFMRSGLVINSPCLFYSQVRIKDCGADFGEDRATANLPPTLPKGSSGPNIASTKESSKRKKASRSSVSADAAGLDYLLGGER